MQGMESLPAFVKQILAQALLPVIWMQVTVAVVAATGAWIAHRRWRAYITSHIGSDERRGLRRAAMRGSERAVFPFSMLLLVLFARGILKQFQPETTILDILVPLLLSLAAIRIIVYILRRGFSPSPALRAWEGIISTTVWIGVALHLLGWLPGVLGGLDSIAVTLGESRVSLLSVSKMVIYIGLFLVLANWLSTFIERRTRRSPYISASMQVGLAKFSRLFLFTLAILVGLNSVGIDLTALTVFGGALGVGLGFGLQRIASNFISGFILLFDRSIKPGDVITVGDRFGWVQELRARYVVVRDRDGVETLIPNENLITSEVTNWSYSDRNVRLKIPVQISYSDDPELAMQVLAEAASANDRVLDDPEPQARLTAFGDSGINLELRVWLADPEGGVGSIRTDIYIAIWKGFKEKGITIPFPQRDVHVIGPGPALPE